MDFKGSARIQYIILFAKLSKSHDRWYHDNLQQLNLSLPNDMRKKTHRDFISEFDAPDMTESSIFEKVSAPEIDPLHGNAKPMRSLSIPLILDSLANRILY